MDFSIRTYRGKRLVDVLLALLVMVVTAWLQAALCCLIRLIDGSPVIFRGRRVGTLGKEFDILKFRTMLVGAEQGSDTTAEGDPRVTPLGALLRAAKLDELPQLINVVRGEMSIVGPRPETPANVRAYAGHDMEVLAARPGITDYASLRFVNMSRLIGQQGAHEAYLSRVMPEKSRLRLLYVRNVRFSTDMRIIIATVCALVTGRAPRWVEKL